MKTFKFLFIIAATIIALESCSPAESSTAVPLANAPIPVKIMPLQLEEVAQPIVSSGQFTTDDETVLSFKTGGVVSRVLVKEGEFVKKGKLLATLNLIEIKAQVSMAELGFEKAQRDFLRAENLYRDSVATLEQYQNAKTALAIASQQLEAARFNLDFSEIRAVNDGYVLKKFVNEGHVIAPGTPIVQTNGAGKSKWIFRTGVSDKEWAAIKVGDEAIIRTDFMDSEALKAKVARKSEGADPMTGAFFIELEVEATKGIQLASGLFGTATIHPSKKLNAWNIPHEALLDGNGNKGFVFITTDNKTAQKAPVTIASIDRDFIRVIHGLEGSSSLITEGNAYLTHNSAITVVE